MISERRMNRAVLVCVVAMVVLLVLVVALNASSGGLVVPNSARPAFANTNLAAPFSAMGFLAASAGLLFAIIVIACALAAGQRLVARAMLIVAGAGVALYATALLGFSLQSRGAQLAPGVEKCFCELDCHLAYAVTDVRTQKTMSSPAGEQRAAGVFYVVTLRTRFDPTTIAPWRGDAPLRPNPRRAEVVDAAGQRYPLRSLQGTDLMTILRPGESYTTRLIFDLPQGVREPCLLLTTPGTFPEPLLIGDENSPLQPKGPCVFPLRPFVSSVVRLFLPTLSRVIPSAARDLLPSPRKAVFWTNNQTPVIRSEADRAPARKDESKSLP